MTIERFTRRSVCAAVIALTSTGAVAEDTGSSFAITRHTIDGGGGHTTGGTYTLFGVIGQPDAGVHTGGTLVVSGGLLVPTSGDVVECPADIDGNGVVDFADVLRILPIPFGTPCEGCPEDVDGDGVITFGDILRVLAAWGPCP